ncbi:MAG: glucosaminidase domain-containing protein [Gammaproteobacteria bacterium]|nr:glucosaminidase domain-containing protein [Gammaproteobacteria bacterium]
MTTPESRPSAIARLGAFLDRRGGIVVPLAAVALWALSVGISGDRGPGSGPLPAFHEIEQVAEKKQEFFDYLTPIVRAENDRIRAQRARLLEIVDANAEGDPPGWQDRRFLEELAEYARLDTEALTLEELLEELNKRIDVIPRSLVLVQAAKESGWGSSRFARRANNLFGQWCYDPGCGMVPQNRSAGRTHEVRSFDSVREAVTSYVRNLNTHPSYAGLREVRADLRRNDKSLSGVRLAEGLRKYSERGEVYVREVQSMIRQNDLEQSVSGT